MEQAWGLEFDPLPVPKVQQFSARARNVVNFAKWARGLGPQDKSVVIEFLRSHGQVGDLVVDMVGASGEYPSSYPFALLHDDFALKSCETHIQITVGSISKLIQVPVEAWTHLVEA